MSLAAQKRTGRSSAMPRTLSVPAFRISYTVCAALKDYQEMYAVQHQDPAQKITLMALALLISPLLMFAPLPSGASRTAAGAIALLVLCGILRRKLRMRPTASETRAWLAFFRLDKPRAVEYTVTLDASGFTESAGANSLSLPWFLLDPKPKELSTGILFPLSQDMDVRVVHQAASDGVAGSLFIPSSVLQEHPDLPACLSALIRSARSRLR